MTNRERNLLQQNARTPKQPKLQERQGKKKNSLTSILQRLGNRTVQRLMIQRRGGESYQLDDETASQINSERANGAPLDSKLQMEMSDQMGFDLSGVRVHNSEKSDSLNTQMNSKAFTTGQDIFFKSGEYNPSSSSGKELLGHELTHVVQQGTGQVEGGSGMTVNAPGDQFEKEADAVSAELNQGAPSSTAQAQEEEELQMQEEEEEMQMQEEEELQMQEEEEEEELQMQEEEEEEELQMQEEEEEEMQMQEEEELQMMGAPELQQQEVPEEEVP